MARASGRVPRRRLDPAAVVRLAVAAATLLAAACAASVTSQMPQDVATALAQEPMRRFDTQHLRVYYPTARREQAVRFAERLERCAAQLKARVLFHNDIADRRMQIILPELTFNNAFTSPISESYAPFAVVPTYQTIDAFSLEMGLPPDPANIACHELTHYVHLQEVAGFSYLLNFLFGEAYTPQLGFDSWFDEGLAVYYETELQPGIGRLAWPFWNGAFAAGVAGRHLRGGDLSEFNRDAFMGNNYLVGSHFIQFLARRYGEWRLWKLIEVQSRAVFFPLWMNVRFWQAYDISLSTLIDEFAADVARSYPVVARPPEQRPLETLGTDARYARAPDGSEALIFDGHDLPPRLVIRGPDGRTRVDHNLVDVVPPRALVSAGAQTSGPPSFTGDGRFVYFTTLDLGSTFQASRLVRVDTASGALTVVERDLRGGGGSISPDGRSYAFSHADGDHHDLALLDVASGAIRTLVAEPNGAFVSLPRFSPDGQRLVASEFDGRRFRIRVFDARDGRVLTDVTDGAQPVHDASWADAHHVVYLRADDPQAGFQVYLADLRGGPARQVTHAPYLAFEPQAAGGTLRFLNRDGWNWTLDEQPIALGDQPAPAPSGPVAGTHPASSAPVAPPPPAPPSFAMEPPPLIPTPIAPAPPLAWPAPAAAGAASPPPAPWTTVPYIQPIWPSFEPSVPFAISDDAPYSALDHLFAPQMHGISFAALGRSAALGDVVLGGGDRLQYHRWALDGFYQLDGQSRAGYGGGFGYSNQQHAPFSIVLQGLGLLYHDTLPAPPAPQMAPLINSSSFVLDKRILEANLAITRAFYGAPAELGVNVVDDDQPNEPTLLVTHRRAAGMFLAATYAGDESTPYSGVRRGLAAEPSVNLYPAVWNTANATLLDARLALAATLPLPLSRRHTLTLGLRARDLFGLPAGDRWLQVGGGTTALSRHPDSAVPSEVTIDQLPDVTFVEALRGYEDYPLATDRIFIAGADYDYPLIVDWGSASSLGLLPAFFLRQLDWQLFGRAATDAHGGPPHVVGGAAVALRTAIWVVPVSLTYQIARRVEDDHALVQLLVLSNE